MHARHMVINLLETRSQENNLGESLGVGRGGEGKGRTTGRESGQLPFHQTPRGPEGSGTL